MTQSNYNDYEVMYSLRRVNDLLLSKLLWSKDPLVYKQSVYIEVLVQLKDLLAYAEKIEHRINFSEDILINDKIKDVTDLILNFRDAACHLVTDRKKYGDNRFSFIEIHGKKKYEFEPTLESIYDDDVAYIMGKNILYLKRHIERAFEELKVVYKNYFGEPRFNFALQLEYGTL